MVTNLFLGQVASRRQARDYPIEHGFDEMKEFAAYYPGVYSYDDTSPNFTRGSRSTISRSTTSTRRS